MKKLLTAISLAIAATFAVANPIGFINYDYGSNSSKALQEVTIGGSTQGPWGIWDLGVLYQSLDSNGSATGLELGFNKGVKVGAVTLKGRLGLGYVDGETNGDGFYSASAEAELPLTQRVGAYANYRYRNTFSSDLSWRSNRAAIGLDFLIAPRTGLRVGYVSTEQNDVRYNGATVTLAHQF